MGMGALLHEVLFEMVLPSPLVEPALLLAVLLFGHQKCPATSF